MTEETAAPAVVQEPVDQGPMTRHEVRQQMAQSRQAAKAEQPSEPVAEPTVDEPTETEQIEEPSDQSDEQPSTEQPSTEQPSEPAEPVQEPEKPVPPKPIRIDIPDDHPLRGMGHDHITAADPAQERVLRAAINSYTRRKEVEDLERQVSEYQEREVRRESQDAALQKVRGTPEYKVAEERYNEIKESMGDEAASEYWRGQQVRLQEAADEEYRERMSKLQEQRNEEAGRRWAEDEWNRTSYFSTAVRTHPEFRTVFGKAVDAFNSEVSLGHYNDLARLPAEQRAEAVHKAFTTFLQTRVLANPDLRAALKTPSPQQDPAAKAAEEQRTREAIRREERERLLKEMAEKRKDSPPHPLGNLASRDRVPVGAAEGDDTSRQNLSAHELRRASRKGARDTARRYFPQ